MGAGASMLCHLAIAANKECIKQDHSSPKESLQTEESFMKVCQDVGERIKFGKL